MCRKICQIFEEDGLVGDGITPDADEATLALRKKINTLRRLEDQVGDFPQALHLFDHIAKELSADTAHPDYVRIRMEIKTQVPAVLSLHPPVQPESIASHADPATAGLVRRRCSVT
jgi:hypothetical protein